MDMYTFIILILYINISCHHHHHHLLLLIKKSTRIYDNNEVKRYCSVPKNMVCRFQWIWNLSHVNLFKKPSVPSQKHKESIPFYPISVCKFHVVALTTKQAEVTRFDCFVFCNAAPSSTLSLTLLSKSARIQQSTRCQKNSCRIRFHQYMIVG